VVEPSAGSVPPGTSRHIAINNQLPGRKREAATFDNLASGHRWSCASHLHQAVDLRDSTHRTGRSACHQFKPSAARPLANIVQRLNEPAFTLENRIYRWQQLVEDFFLYDVTCCP
jgi:hypothetical protein